MSEDTSKKAEVKAIFPSIAAVMEECKAIEKNNTCKSYGGASLFNYRGIDDVYAEFHPLFVKHHIILGVEVIEHQMTERPTKNGVTLQHVLRIKFRFVSTIDGSTFESTTVGEASDTGDKGASKAISIGLKYLFFATFLIPTNDPADDADSFKPEWQDNDGEPRTTKPVHKSSKPSSNGDAVIHFGKNKGIALNDVSDDTLRWYAFTWNPDEGKYPATDTDYELKTCAANLAAERGIQKQPF